MRRTLTFVLVFLLSLAGFSIALANELNYINLPLHNDRAEVGTDCPSSGGPYWHFVITPNNGHSYFITFHLNLGDASTYDISVFIPNGGQLDNVFVAVPAGKTLESLNKTGSSADVYWDGEMQQPDKFTLSHVCPSAGYEALTVSKTVRTSYTRTHAWSLEKMVSPLDLYLYIPGQGASMPSTGVAVWTIDVNYEGYADSDWHISGQINITNTGTLDAVITGVNDVLAGIPIAVDCSVAFPYLLAQGETLTCIYNEDSYFEGSNVVTVTTERSSYTASAAILWGDPTTEINKTVTVVDSQGGILGTVTAPDDATFTYDKLFDWMDYQDEACGNHTYENTAQLMGEDFAVLDEAKAALMVHVQCHVFTTAYAKGNDATCFIPTFRNWGWTNFIASKPAYQTWSLWAGAGQCNTSKGVLVGSVSVTYNAAGYVTVNFNVSMPYVVRTSHVYAGTTPFPLVKAGNKWVYTNAPGQYTNNSPFSGPIYVIVHAEVGIPDLTFP